MTLRSVLAATLVALPFVPAAASTLRGSHASMLRQHEVARKNDFTFLRTSKQLQHFVDEDRLDSLSSTADYTLADVSFPFARPSVAVFIERLAREYRNAFGEPLVVTSLTRPSALQPRNASPLSVHPTGMAVDLRVPSDADARRWLEKTLLALEDKGVLDVTREQHPSHYHVAVFPEAYERYVATLPPLAAAVSRAVSAPAAAAALLARAGDALADAANTQPTAQPFALSLLAALSLLLVFGAVRVLRAQPASAKASGSPNTL